MQELIEARQRLEAFLLSRELEQLETRFTKFNVFEELGVARREVHHSSFLAFLLNPGASHGLRDLFLRKFLQQAVRQTFHPVISAIELDAMEFNDIEIKREYENIDVLLNDRRNQIVVVIENKVGAKQHDDQLQRYFETISKSHPDYKFLGVYLTPENEDPGHDQYVAASYEMVRHVVDGMLVREDVLMPSSVRSILEQYVDLLRTRFMADQELKKLCESIYRRHRKAIDILMDNLPKPFDRALAIVGTLVKEANFTEQESDSAAVRFTPPEFEIPPFQSETAWLSTGQMVYAEVKTKNEALVFQVKMDGGTMIERQIVHEFASTHKPFHPQKSATNKYQILYTRIIAEETDLDVTDDELDLILRKGWKKILDTDLADMQKACKDLYDTGVSF